MISSSRWGTLPMSVKPGHQYANPPIVEAIVEFQVTPRVDVTVDDLGRILSDRAEFLPPDPQIELAGTLQLTESDQVFGSATGHRVGHVFTRSDQLLRVHALRNRFAVSQQGNYAGWPAIRNQALDIWGLYKSVARPVSLDQVGVRYVNNIRLPTPFFEVKDYLRTSVDLSPYLPQAMTGFFMQVSVPLDDSGGPVARITSTVAPSAAGTGDDLVAGASLILDIDAFMPMPDLDPDSVDTVVSVLDTLRDAKNYVFESCITDATRRLID